MSTREIRLGIAAVLLSTAGAVAAPQAPEAPASAESAVAAGVRQVEEGDFEAAVATLEAANARLRGDPRRVRLLVQADIQLAVAHVALDQTPAAVQAFTEALTLDPQLRLPTDRFSPKVLRAFETARAQTTARTASPGHSSSGRKTALIAGIGVAGAATAVVLATRGSALPVFSGARFGTPVIECPNGSDNLQLPFTILVEAANASGTLVPISSVSSVVTIANGTETSEIGFASNKPTTAVPSSLPAKQTVTVQVTSFLLCGNGPGDAPRFNDWTGRVTFTTPVGIFMIDVADHMRVNIP
jgi:putative NIF3 family GTP cyclohydrolase 1 type 2